MTQRPDPVSPMPDDASNYDKLVLNLIPRVIRTLGVATPEGMHTMMELVEVYDAILVERGNVAIESDDYEAVGWLKDGEVGFGPAEDGEEVLYRKRPIA